MAWQKDVGIGNYGSKIRTKVTLVSQDRSGNSSRVRVEVAIYNGGSSRSWDASVSTAISGTVSASKSTGIEVSAHSWLTLWDQTFTIGHNANGSKSFSITGTLGSTGTSTFGSGGSATVSGSLPQLWLAPSAPTIGSTTFVSDTSVRIAWTNRASTRGPYSKIEVQRWERRNGKWWNHGTLSGSATSFTNTGVPANDEIRYRIRAVGPGGTSGWVTGGTLGTTPAAPSNVRAVKQGQSIRLSWTDNAAPTNRARTFVIQDSPNGGAWVQVGQIGGSATTWTHSDADPAKTHRYRVQARITSAGRLLASGFSAASETVQLQAPPKQPTRQEPKDAGRYVVGEALRFAWTHNPVDTTDQTAAELQWRIDGGTWTTVTVTGSATTTTLVPDAGGKARAQLEWRVRTRGDHPDWSPWSTTNGPLLSTRPTVTVQMPVNGEPLDTSRAAVAWAYERNGTDAHLAQAAYQVELVRDGAVIEQASGTTAELATLRKRLDNNTEYTVRVRARNGDELWSAWDAVTFTTDFPTPPPFLVTPVWDHESASVAVTVHEVQGQDGPTIEYRWAGLPHASVSERVVDGTVVRTNLAENPSWEAGLAQPGLNEAGPSSNATITLDDAWALAGTQSIRVDPTETSNGDSTVYPLWYERDGGAQAVRDKYGMVPGETFTIGATIHLEAAQTGPLDTQARRITVNTVNSVAGTTYSRVVSDAAPNRAGTHRVALTFTVPDDADAGLVIRLHNGSTTGPVWWDGLTIEKGATTGSYFDGSSPLITDQVRVDVERRDTGGDWVLIASGVDTSTTVIDRTPRIGAPEYRAISRTVLPTETVGPEAGAPWPFPIVGAWVSGGAGFARVCTAAGSSAQESPKIEQATQQFAGHSQPTAFFGTQRTHELSFSGTIPLPPNVAKVSTRDEWIALLHEFGIVCYRDPTGRKRFGLLDVSFAQTGPVESLSLNVTEVQFSEGVTRVSDLELEAML